MFDLTRFGLSDTFEVSAAVPEVAHDAGSAREVAARVVRFLYENIVDKDSGERSLALVQCLVAQPFDHLPADLQDVVVSSSVAAPRRRGRCLTLFASVGDEQVVNDERIGHELATVTAPGPAADTFSALAARVLDRLERGAEHPPDGLLRSVGRSYAIGYVADAREYDAGSHWSGVVVAYGIRSVLTVTARLTPDVSVTVALYSKVTIPESTADSFMPVAIGLKLAMLRCFLHGDEAAVLRAENDALRELLSVRHTIALEQSNQLQQTLELAEQRAAALAASEAALAGSEERASAILRTALDAIIVMDAAGRVVEWNPAASTTFGYPRDEAVGRPVADLIVPDDLRSRHVRGIEHYLETGRGPFLGQRVEISAMRADGSVLPVELTITPVHSADGPLFTGFVRDITERREHQAALLASREGFAHIARTLQRSLLPAALPDIPGLDLGAVFHPSRAGSDVGGDFYDVFRTGRSDLMLTLGDVCGKGPEAAAITAIARYTLRAVAPDLRHPTTVLRRLNHALLEHDIGERFCSIVAVRAVPIVRGMRLSVCCAGHAQPIVLRAAGNVERVGVPGDLLGIFPDVRLFEETVQLSHGDVFVLFTDGVTEASREGEQFGEDRLMAALLDCHGRSATEMVDHVLDAVLAFGGEQSRDDIAILALRIPPSC